jgi:hypothetical protein
MNNNNNTIANAVRHASNLAKISTEVFWKAQQQYGISLDEQFKPILLNVVNTTITQFGRKSPNMNDQQHLDGLNKIIVDECLKLVAQYRSTMGEQTNPFAEYAASNAENGGKMGGDNFKKMVDDLASARGYSFGPREPAQTPRMDFAEPTQERKLTQEDFNKKLEVERGLFNASSSHTSGGMHLSEMLPPDLTPKNGVTPAFSYNTARNQKDEYQKRLNMIKERDSATNNTEPSNNGNNGPVNHANGPVNHANGPVSHTNGPVNHTNGPVNHTNGNGNTNTNSGPNNSVNIIPTMIPRPDEIKFQGTNRLSLDFRRSMESCIDGIFVLRFPKMTGVRGLQLSSCLSAGYKQLLDEGTIGIRIENLPSRYGNLNLFSKIFLDREVNNNYHFLPSEGDPMIFDSPIDLSYLQVSFRGWDDQSISLDSLDVEQILKNSKNGTMKIVCRDNHYLAIGDAVSMLSQKVAQRLEVIKVIDALTFITEIPNKMTDGIQIKRLFPRFTMNFIVF